MAAVSTRGERRPGEEGEQQQRRREPDARERDDRRDEGDEQQRDLDERGADLATPEEDDRPQQVEDELAAEQAQGDVGRRRSASHRSRRVPGGRGPRRRPSAGTARVQTGPNTASGGVHDGFDRRRYHGWPPGVGQERRRSSRGRAARGRARRRPARGRPVARPAARPGHARIGGVGVVDRHARSLRWRRGTSSATDGRGGRMARGSHRPTVAIPATCPAVTRGLHPWSTLP